MMSLTLKAGSCILVVAVALILLPRSSDEHFKENVLLALLRAENKVLPNPQLRVAVGFGACEDVISDGIHVLDQIKAEAPDVPEHFNDILNKEMLEKSFAYFFRHGAAAERYMRNNSLFHELVDAALSLPDTRQSLGGNAPVMASRFKKEGLSVLLASTVSPALRSQIDADIKVVGPQLENDDIHLLLEYAKGRSWGEYITPRANRFIVHNDENNPYLMSMEDFIDHVVTFSPHLLVVSGLQMMDNYPFRGGERLERLTRLNEFLFTVPRSTLTHFELASFAEEDCFKDVLDSVLGYMDSLGMNEQELPSLHSVLTNGSLTLISDPYPRIATTLDHMRAVWRLLGPGADTTGYTARGGRPVTRIHVHTLAYQAIMTARRSPWKNTMSATAKASLTANRHVCGSRHISTSTARILMDEAFTTSRERGSRVHFQAERPVACWTEDDIEICVAPNLVCTEVVQTGGGGDNISSAGLVLQL